jgi:hypothetical protein
VTIADGTVRVRPPGVGAVGMGPHSRRLAVLNVDDFGPDGRDCGRAADLGGPDQAVSPDRTTGLAARAGTVRSWPLLLLALPAAVAVWSGWVGIGQMTGFGQVHPLPGIWGSLHLDTAVTLPVGVEAYAAYALRAWLSASAAVSGRTRRFARWSAVGSLLLGMAGQVAYHLLAQDRVSHAPWGVTTAVSCLPVLVLGMGAALAHMLRSDAHGLSLPSGPDRTVAPADHDDAGLGRPAAKVTRDRLAEAQDAAGRLVRAGERVSRRNLRRAGLHGSNAELGLLALMVRAHLPRLLQECHKPAGPGSQGDGHAMIRTSGTIASPASGTDEESTPGLPQQL